VIAPSGASIGRPPSNHGRASGPPPAFALWQVPAMQSCSTGHGDRGSHGAPLGIRGA